MDHVTRGKAFALAVIALLAMRQVACSVEVNPQPLPPGGGHDKGDGNFGDDDGSETPSNGDGSSPGVQDGGAVPVSPDAGRSCEDAGADAGADGSVCVDAGAPDATTLDPRDAGDAG